MILFSRVEVDWTHLYNFLALFSCLKREYVKKFKLILKKLALINSKQLFRLRMIFYSWITKNLSRKKRLIFFWEQTREKTFFGEKNLTFARRFFFYRFYTNNFFFVCRFRSIFLIAFLLENFFYVVFPPKIFPFES